MTATVTRNLEKPHRAVRDPVRKQLRGSSLLLAGRLLSRVINFASQLLIVRHLSTQDYGALAYALSVVMFCKGFSTLGLRRGVMRFVPLYHERGDYGRILGVLALIVGVVVGTGTLVITGIHGWPELVSRLVSDKGLPIDLLLVLVFLVPVEALDEVLIALFACFAHPKAIFYRKHLLAPLLKFAAVLLLVLLRADVRFLAYGYLAASTIGVALYVGILLRLLRRDGTLEGMSASHMQVPARELFGFSIPLLTSNLVAVVMHSADTMILGYFHPSTEVAMYRVILPAASLNTIVLASFGLLYMPLAARLFARGDFAGIRTMYWRTALWMAVFSFPVFAATFSLARSVTVTLYGSRYAESALLLQLFAIAYYFGVTLGNNGLTLKVLGKLRYVVTVNVAAMAVNIVLAFLLIPKYGALGAALATAAAMILHNIFKQIGLRAALGLQFLDAQVVPVYAVIAVCTLALLFLQLVFSPSLYVGLPLAAISSLLVLRLSRHRLLVEETFPELLRLPLLGSLLRNDTRRRSS